MKSGFKGWLAGIAAAVCLLGATAPAQADYKGGHLVYVKFDPVTFHPNMRFVNSIAIYNSRDGGKRCISTRTVHYPGFMNQVRTNDIKTGFHVVNNWWFSIYAYNSRDCSGPMMYQRAWTPRSDSNKYWYSVMVPGFLAEDLIRPVRR